MLLLVCATAASQGALAFGAACGEGEGAGGGLEQGARYDARATGAVGPIMMSCLLGERGRARLAERGLSSGCTGGGEPEAGGRVHEGVDSSSKLQGWDGLVRVVTRSTRAEE